ncbi:LysR family transcriptional regulator [Saccharomonospora sp. NPDC006951]
MERDELECFLVLADELHFGRTAERMRLSRARVSQLIQRLERRVGAALFVRTSRRVAMTTLGKQLRAETEQHHVAIEAALARAAEHARRALGALHVGFANPLAGEIVVRAADALRATHPDLAIEFCEVPLANPYGELRNGQFDVQLVDFSSREDDLAGGEPLLEEDRMLALPGCHPLSINDSLALEDLADVALLSIDGDVPSYWLEDRVPARTPGGRRIEHGPAVTNLQEALTLVSAAQGAIITAAHTAAYYPRPGIVYLPLRDAPRVTYRLLWRAGENTGAVNAFRGAVRAMAREAEKDTITATRLSVRALC